MVFFEINFKTVNKNLKIICNILRFRLYYIHLYIYIFRCYFAFFSFCFSLSLYIFLVLIAKNLLCNFHLT